MNGLKTHLKALLWMFFGLFFVFGTVILMNSDTQMLKDNKKKESGELNIAKVVKPKPKPKPKPEPKPQQTQKQKSSSAPELSSSLSGIDTGLESFMSSDMDMGSSLLGEVDNNVVMSEESVDKAPQPTQRSTMQYPKNARKNGVTGYVLMNLLISDLGTVEKVKVLESVPSDVFDEVAIEGIKSWQFKPAQYQGKSVKVWAKQKIKFDLQ